MNDGGHRWHGFNCPCGCCNGFCGHRPTAILTTDAPLTAEQVNKLKALWKTPKWRRPLLRLVWRAEAAIRG